MHISLTDRLDDYVREKVSSGLYNNASEVIREALRRQIALEETDALKRERLRAEIDPAWQQADQGAAVPFDLQGILSELDHDMKPDA